MRFADHRPKPNCARLYSRASIYAATARYEPLGMASLEAAFSRCAIVANDIPSFREIWGDAALYFRTNDAASLAENIRLLNEDRAMRRAYAELAYSRARERFTTKRMIDECLQLYRSLVRFESKLRLRPVPLRPETIPLLLVISFYACLLETRKVGGLRYGSGKNHGKTEWSIPGRSSRRLDRIGRRQRHAVSTSPASPHFRFAAAADPSTSRSATGRTAAVGFQAAELAVKKVESGSSS